MHGSKDRSPPPRKRRVHIRIGSGLRLGLVLGCLAALPALASTPSCPVRPMRVAFTDAHVPPFVNGSGGTIQESNPGLLIKELRSVAVQVGCPVQLVRLPQRRLELELSQGSVDLAVGYGDTPARRAQWQFPETPDGSLSQRHAIGQSPVAWLVLGARRAELEAQWRRGELGGRLGVVPSSVASSLVAQRGLKAHMVEYPDRVLLLLERDRFDAVAIPLAAYAPQLAADPTRFATLDPPLGHINYFAPASKAFYRRHPELVRHVWEALCA